MKNQYHSYLCTKAKNYIFFMSLSFLAEAQSKLEKRGGQKTVFGRGAH
jgi:hypothetical protein